MRKPARQNSAILSLRAPVTSTQPAPESGASHPEWTKGLCPNCGYPDADIDSDGVLWCPACGYSKNGCYT